LCGRRNGPAFRLEVEAFAKPAWIDGRRRLLRQGDARDGQREDKDTGKNVVQADAISTLHCSSRQKIKSYNRSTVTDDIHGIPIP
jgi:hypothetical protein